MGENYLPNFPNQNGTGLATIQSITVQQYTNKNCLLREME